ncbi:hypothetical protein U3516DRAFT_752166 [Neocallimastix sp. 'constans']
MTVKYTTILTYRGDKSLQFCNSTPKWYDMGALYVVILIQPRYKVCLILVVCCGWNNMIRYRESQ